MKFNIKAFALASGILWGLAVCVSVWLVLLFDFFPSDIINTIGKYYIGLDVSILGSFIGSVYGFIDGSIGGLLFAWIYNKLVD